jgi:hypothetical protein
VGRNFKVRRSGARTTNPMRIIHKLILGLAVLGVVALSAPARAQAVGSKLPPVELEGLAQTGAKTFDDFLGRAVLLEFFAYW